MDEVYLDIDPNLPQLFVSCQYANVPQPISEVNTKLPQLFASCQYSNVYHPICKVNIILSCPQGFHSHHCLPHANGMFQKWDETGCKYREILTEFQFSQIKK